MGRIRETTLEEAVERALSMVGLELDRPGGLDPHPIRYRLKKYNGGKDPFAEHAAQWSPDWKVWTLDCSGLAAWSLGYSRFHEAFPEFGGWISTDSMLLDARRGSAWFERIDGPELGALVVTESERDPHTGKRKKAGHVGILTGVPAEWDPGLPSWDLLEVTHCSSSASRRLKAAVQTTDAGHWGRVGCTFLRYLKAA